MLTNSSLSTIASQVHAGALLSGDELPEPVVEITPFIAVKRRGATWSGMKAEIVQTTQRTRLEFGFRSNWHLLAVYEQGSRNEGETNVEGASRSTLRDFARKLVFVPAGHQYREWQDPRVFTRVIYLYIDPAAMPLSRQTGEAPQLTPKVFFESQPLRDTSLKVAALIEDDAEASKGYLEALGAVLMHELVRLHEGAPVRQAPARGGLAPWQQRVVSSFIEENLSTTIPLARLAELARLSPFYFSRAFKESFGLPPHRYHIGRRIEHAKSLLAKSATSVTEIGLTLGFSETSSFTATFRKITGLTPTAYRRGFA